MVEHKEPHSRLERGLVLQQDLTTNEEGMVLHFKETTKTNIYIEALNWNHKI